MHVYLQREHHARAGGARRNNPYNEFLMDGERVWAAHLPLVIEAFIAATSPTVPPIRDRFVDAYGLRAEDVPILVFTCDCERPFALGKVVPYDPCAV